MDPATMAALSVLTSPSGAQGGGGQVPSFTTKSAASAGLDSSGSAYDQRSSTGDFIVGGNKGTNWVMIAAIGLGALLLMRYIK